MSEIKIGGVPIERIVLDVQPRQSVAAEAVQQMVVSLSEVGQLSPIGLEPQGDKFGIRFGNTRYLAAKELGWDSILARIYPPEKAAGDALRMAVVENTVRASMTFVELADVIHEYAKIKAISLTQAGKELGFKQPLVSKCLKIEERLTPANKKALVDAGVGGSLAYLISQETEAKAQSELVGRAIKENWTRTDIEKHFRSKRKPMTRVEFKRMGAKAVLELPKGQPAEAMLELLKTLANEIKKLAAISSTPETIARVLKEQSNVQA